MKIDLKDKNALVCASSRGLGFSCALNLAKAGCNIILTGRNKKTLEIASKKIKKDLGKKHKNSVNYIEVDLDNISKINFFLSQLDSYNPMDIIILNSGGPAPGKFSDFTNMEDFHNETTKITYPAGVLMKKYLPHMKKQKWGRIINISSIGLVKPITGLSVSNASRGHLGALMTGIANENAHYGITLNTVMPGIIWTDRQKYLTENDARSLGVAYKEMKKRKSLSIPAEKMGKPDDVGFLVTFLASDYASYLNSQFIAVDGGLLGLLR